MLRKEYIAKYVGRELLVTSLLSFIGSIEVTPESIISPEMAAAIEAAKQKLRGAEVTDLITRIDSFLAVFGGTSPIRLGSGDSELSLLAEARKELTAFNTAWQHDPPERGDTKWVKLRVVDTGYFDEIVVEAVE